MHVEKATWPPTGVRLLWRSDEPGSLVFPPISEHRVRVHASPATPAACGATGMRYVRERGDSDLMPAGAEGGYDMYRASETLEVRIPVGLVDRVAAEIDRPFTALDRRHLVRDPRIAHLAWALDEEERSLAPAGPLYVDCLGVALTVHLLGLTPGVRDDARGLSASQLKRVVDFIEGNLHGVLLLDTLARVAGVSSAHLRHWFKERTASRYIAT